MRLPAALRWVEVDFPHVIALKNEKLAGESPVCRLERMACDLSDREERRKLFAALGEQAHNALVITEGVIFYLSREQAAGLAEDLLAVPAFRHWIQDYRNGGLGAQRWMRGRRWARVFRDAPLRFDALDWVGFFVERGWAVEKNVRAADEAKRIRRWPPFIFPWSAMFWLLPKAKRELFRHSAGYVMLRRAK
jgi:O-methyltransferase involved in polyketide biosynthesis